MEIYRNDTATAVSIDVPPEIIAASTAVDLTATRDGTVIHTFSTVSQLPTLTGYSVTLPWHLVNEDQDLFLNWTIKYTDGSTARTFTTQQFVQVVTPVLPLAEIARIGNYNRSTEEGRLDTIDLEHRVRYAIQTFTGQNFGKYRATVKIKGTGDMYLNLPAPLLAIESADFPYSNLELLNGGLTLRSPEKIWFGIKDAPPDDILDQFHYTNGPIAVRNRSNFFHERVYHTISGLWGYHDVPGDVKQAARLLAADYACDESLWRDRYIDSVRAGNWRFEVNEMAFGGTGNVMADQILIGYRKISLSAV